MSPYSMTRTVSGVGLSVQGAGTQVALGRDVRLTAGKSLGKAIGDGEAGGSAARDDKIVLVAQLRRMMLCGDVGYGARESLAKAGQSQGAEGQCRLSR